MGPPMEADYRSVTFQEVPQGWSPRIRRAAIKAIGPDKGLGCRQCRLGIVVKGQPVAHRWMKTAADCWSHYQTK
eukprot:5174460-Amphidinium_carterae.1